MFLIEPMADCVGVGCVGLKGIGFEVQTSFGLCLKFILEVGFWCLICAFDYFVGSLRSFSWLTVSWFPGGASANVCTEVDVVVVIWGIRLYTSFWNWCDEY